MSSYNGQSLYNGLFVKASSVPDLNVNWSEGLFTSPSPNANGPLTYVQRGLAAMGNPGSGFEYVAILQIQGTDTGAVSLLPIPAGQGSALLAASAITNTGATQIFGDVDMSPAGAITPGGWTVHGTIHNGDAQAATVKSQAQASFTAKQSLGLAGTVIPSVLDGQTLTPGNYRFASTAATLNGVLTLNGAGTYIIYTGSTLTVGNTSSATVTLSGGASAANVYWIVGSSATVQGAGTVFNGSITAQASISQSGAAGGVYNGSWAALTGAITFASATTVTSSAQSGTIPPAGTISIKYGTPVAAGSGLAVYPSPDPDNFVLAELFYPAAAMQFGTTTITNANISNVVLSAEFGGR
jgi:hypothetical protein